MELTTALEAFEKEVGITSPHGARGMPPSIRYREILIKLRQAICPKLREVEPVVKGDKSVLTSTIVDAIIVGVTNLPIPAMTVARAIALIGINDFCKNPTSILPS